MLKTISDDEGAGFKLVGRNLQNHGYLFSLVE